MTWRYKGSTIFPAVPGVPARNLTNREYEHYAERYGRALQGVYVKDDQNETPSPASSPEEAQED